MKIILRIRRYNPEAGVEPFYRDYEVEVEPSQRVLDAILFVKQRLDPTLAVRKSCAHGVCGSDAMRINGVERLACKTLVKDVARSDGDAVVLEPLRSMPVERDLMVSQEAFFAKYRSVSPFLIPAGAVSEKERPQSPRQRARFDEPTKCILCSACYSACPVLADKNPSFTGPAALVQAARFVFDSRDKGISERLDVLDAANGAWACENHFDCTRVCPRGIKVTKAINETKRAITAFKGGGHQAV
jgi:succinate dehydrogenase / fumarate reductase, iron-sulfur subunit